MKLYFNGDSHTAGAELVADYCFASDDPGLKHMGELAHPGCLNKSFGYKLAKILNAGYNCEAISASSNHRILRTTRDFLDQRHASQNFIIIGWSTWEREEWQYEDQTFQVTASGTDQLPESLQDDYKKWVIDQTIEVLIEKEQQWHTALYKLHTFLQEKKIKHLFFNSYSHFGNIEEQVDWDNCYLDPYTQAGTYWHWCEAQGFKTVNNGYHYGEDAHNAWAKYLLPRLTDVTSSSNIVRVKPRKINTAPRRIK